MYPERREEQTPGRFEQTARRIAAIFAPLAHPRASRFQWVIDAAAVEAAEIGKLADGDVLPFARALGQRLRREGFTDRLVARAFALVREVAGRTRGMRHFDVQLVGGLVLLKGMVAEMETGEGKTLTATLAASTAALAGIPVHVVTVNDYLAVRDAEWMGPVYRALGLTAGTITQGLQPDTRRAAYGCNITYCTNKELTFDYLKDRIVLWDRPGQVRLQLERLYEEDSRIDRLLLRGLHYAIVDEADSVLIDEARTPLIISSEAKDFTEQALYREAFDIARELKPGEDFAVAAADRAVVIRDAARFRIEQFPWREARAWTTRRQREELVRQALTALNLFDRDKHYLVRDGKVQIIDEYTGRVMPDRSWERGLHQLIEIKEACEMSARKETRARISYQRFFRRYIRLAGMTGTAKEVAGELWSTYNLPVVKIPTNRPCVRRHLPQLVCSTSRDKWEAVIRSVSDLYKIGRPVLIGTRTVAVSDHVSGLLEEAGLPHLVLNARQDKEEAEIIARAGQEAAITVATNMAGRGTDILLGPGIAERGGLHVLAVERNEAGRIDRQLFGRCGRQGDPGTCQAIISLEDELVSLYAGNLFRRLAALPYQCLPSLVRGRAAGHIGNILFWKARKTIERLHRRIRRTLLQMDEHVTDALAFSGRQE